MRGSN